MSSINKKGLSEVIATTIFILLVIVAIGILWTATKPLLIDLSPQFNCAQAQIEQPLDILDTCYNTQTNDVELTLKRQLAGSLEINRIDFAIRTDQEVHDFFCGENCEDATILKPGQTKTYFFKIENQQPQSVVVGVDNCALQSAEIKETC